MSKQALANLFKGHLEGVAQTWSHALAASGFDAAIVAAGEPLLAFRDDQTYPFRANAQFRQWVPLGDTAPGSFVYLEPGRRARLVFHKPRDFWHRPAQLPAEGWVAQFDVVEIDTREAARAALPEDLSHAAFLGEPFEEVASWGIAGINPAGLVRRLDFARARKSAYEVECLREANRIGARGHRDARDAFLAGESEYGIHAAFLRGCAQREQELPYNAIVALNEHGATLHHQTLDREAPQMRGSLVIDAGASFRGYGSDITRTWVHEDPEFHELVARMDALQRALCAEAQPGRAWPDVHRLAVEGVARVLVDSRLVRSSAEAAVDSGVARLFFPHGIGHLLGLQVHDVGGTMADEEGTEIARPTLDPALRLTRTLEPGFVVTMEPGLYFIEALLRSARASPTSRDVDWPRVERLARFGGVRIEDDLLVTAKGHENLTRPVLEPLLAR